MRSRQALAAAVVLIAGLFSHQASAGWFTVLGTYVAKNENAAVMLQMVQTPDNHVPGQWTAVVLLLYRLLEYFDLSAADAVW
jgi:hypothetical protein